jgi:hypothetical protein
MRFALHFHCLQSLRTAVNLLPTVYHFSSLALFHQPLRWRRHVPPKLRFIINPHGAIPQNTAFCIVTDYKTSNSTFSSSCSMDNLTAGTGNVRVCCTGTEEEVRVHCNRVSSDVICQHSSTLPSALFDRTEHITVSRKTAEKTTRYNLQNQRPGYATRATVHHSLQLRRDETNGMSRVSNFLADGLSDRGYKPQSPCVLLTQVPIKTLYRDQ